MKWVALVLRIGDVIGQTRAIDRLRTLHDSRRLHHALLFVGPKGVGKTTAARAFARRLLCARPTADGDSCGACPACVKMDAATHADYHEVGSDDRTIKIEAVREAERWLRLRPLEGLIKVLVIEDAHKTTVEGQNALLKTLEEPPGSTQIFLTTSRLGALLPTVVSRCQRVTFEQVPTSAIERFVADRRSLGADDARLVASVAQGSIGRAIEIDIDELRKIRDEVMKVDRALAFGDRNAGTAALDFAQDLGTDRAALSDLFDLLLSWIRDQVVIASGAGAPIENVDLEPELRSLAEGRGLAPLLDRAKAVLEARRQLDLPFNLNAQMIAEQLFLDLTGQAPLVAYRR